MKIIIPKSSRVVKTKEERGEKQDLKRKNGNRQWGHAVENARQAKDRKKQARTDRKLRLKRAKKLNRKVDRMLAVSCFAVCLAAALMEAEKTIKEKKS